MRWYRFLMRLFPSTHLASQSGEMLDSLEYAPTTFRARLTESWSIVHASVGAWVRHSRTPQGVRGGAFFGAFVWLGLVIGIGPIRRALHEVEGPCGAALGMTSAHFFVPAAIVLVIAMALLVWNRAGAAVVGSVGIGLALHQTELATFTTSTHWSMRCDGSVLRFFSPLHFAQDDAGGLPSSPLAPPACRQLARKTASRSTASSSIESCLQKAKRTRCLPACLLV